MSNRAINERAYSVAYECQNCGDFPETTSFKSYAAKHERKSQPTRGQLSLLDVQQSVRGYPTSNDCQQHSALPKTMPLARV